MARNGRTKGIYKGTFICIQTLHNILLGSFSKEVVASLLGKHDANSILAPDRELLAPNITHIFGF